MAVDEGRALVDELRRRGFAIHLDPNRPDRIGFTPALSADLARRVREHKAALIEAVRQADREAIEAWARAQVARFRPAPEDRRERLKRIWDAIDEMDREKNA